MDIWLALERGVVFTVFWLGCPNVRNYWEGLGVCGKISFIWTLEIYG